MTLTKAERNLIVATLGHLLNGGYVYIGKRFRTLAPGIIEKVEAEAAAVTALDKAYPTRRAR